MKELRMKEWFESKMSNEARRQHLSVNVKRAMIDDEYVTVYIEEFISETEKAINVKLATGYIDGPVTGYTTWIPKSAIESLPEQKVTTTAGEKAEYIRNNAIEWVENRIKHWGARNAEYDVPHFNRYIEACQMIKADLEKIFVACDDEMIIKNAENLSVTKLQDLESNYQLRLEHIKEQRRNKEQ